MNKLTAAILTVIILYAYNSRAALPDIITDPNIRDTVEYLDGKLKAAEDVTRNFTDATKTVTVAGTLDIGYERVVASGTTSVRAQCSTGKKVLGCGCVVANGVTIACWDDAGTTPPSCLASGQAGIAVTASAYCARVK